jgi:hypothetical protein
VALLGPWAHRRYLLRPPRAGQRRRFLSLPSKDFP